MAEKTKEYSNGNVTIVWKPGLCIHSGNCVQGLGEVFRPKERPWIKVDAASNEALVEQVRKCPSGALSFYFNEGKKEPVVAEDPPAKDGGEIELKKNGPLLFHGEVRIKTNEGTIVTKQGITAFCRCGASSNKPYCDGSHRKINFLG